MSEVEIAKRFLKLRMGSTRGQFNYEVHVQRFSEMHDERIRDEQRNHSSSQVGDLLCKAFHVL